MDLPRKRIKKHGELGEGKKGGWRVNEEWGKMCSTFISKQIR